LSNFNQFRFSWQIFTPVTNNKFHVNLSSGSGADTSGQTNERINMKLSCAFREYAKRAQNYRFAPINTTVTTSQSPLPRHSPAILFDFFYSRPYLLVSNAGQSDDKRQENSKGTGRIQNHCVCFWKRGNHPL